MFKDLKEVLAKASLSMTISAKDDSISVTIVPKGKAGVSLSNTPLAISGTAEELDEKLVPTIISSLGESLGFLTNAAEFKEAAKAQEKTAKATPAKTAPAATATKKEETKKEEAPKFTPTKEQKTAIDKAKKSVEDAKKATDPDIVTFHKKQMVALYEKTGMPAEKVTALAALFDTIVPSGGAAETRKAPDLFANKADTGAEKPEVEEKVEQEELQPEEDETDQPETVTDAVNAEDTDSDEDESNEVDKDDIF